MFVCLRKLPKIGLSVVPAFAYIPPLRSGTAAPPLLSLPYVRFICFADSTHNRVFAMQKLAVVYAKLNRIYLTFLLYRKYRFLSETSGFCVMKNTDFICAFLQSFVSRICTFLQETIFSVMSLQRQTAYSYGYAERIWIFFTCSIIFLHIDCTCL